MRSSKPALEPGTDRGGRYLVALVPVVLMVAAWSLATPLTAAPDEPSQVAQAAALVRGQFDVAHATTRIGMLSSVQVPAWVAIDYRIPSCFAFQPTHSARCSTSISSATNPVRVNTQFSNYPPLYFAMTGLPTLWLSGPRAFHAMRLVATLLNAALLALGIHLLARYHSRRAVLLGALVAITPMVLFMASVVNNSGLEIAGGFAAWCAGLCVIEERAIPPRLAVWTSVAFALFIVSRPLSPVNAGVVLAVLAVLAGRKRRRELRVLPGARLIGLAILASLVTAGIFLAVGGVPDLLGGPPAHPLNLVDRLHLVISLDPGLLRQAIGLFGWTDTAIPSWVMTLWIVMVTVVCLAGLVWSPRFRLALLLLALAVFLLPVIFEIPKINAIGPYWQGRYWLPLLVGIPLAASAQRRPGSHGRRPLGLPPLTAATLRGAGVALLCGAVAWAQIDTFVIALHRYTTGLGRPPGTPLEWTPPGGVALTVGLFVAGELLFVAVLGWWSIRPRTPLRDLRLHRWAAASGAGRTLGNTAST